MSTAKRPGGLYYTAQGKAVDAEGVEIKDAPRPTPDTPPDKQPGAAGAATPEERMGRAIADALSGKTPAKPARASSEAPGVEETASQRAGEAATTATTATADTPAAGESGELPKIADLPARLATLTMVEDVKAMKKTDKRAGAKKLYAARIKEIEAVEGAE